ncbi:MAG: PqqD family protein [Betaproteobacteria bacterium]|nr:PqqD family protein [Betaproteobacteria bacterium]
MNSTVEKPAPTLASRVRVADDVLFQELQGEGVLLNLNSGMYFGLDAVGTRIWQLIAEQEQLGEVARLIEEEFDVSPEQCASDLLALVAWLGSQGLVTIQA